MAGRGGLGCVSLVLLLMLPLLTTDGNRKYNPLPSAIQLNCVVFLSFLLFCLDFNYSEVADTNRHRNERLMVKCGGDGGTWV